MEDFIHYLIRNIFFGLIFWMPFMTGEVLRWAISGGRHKLRWGCLWDIGEGPGLFDPSIWLGLAVWGPPAVWFLAGR